MTTPMTMRVVPIIGGPPGGPGPKGDNGANLRIDNTVSTASALPGTPSEGDGAVYAVADENALYQWTEAGGWVKAAELQGPAGTTDWDDLTNKPATFPPTIGTTATTALAGDTAVLRTLGPTALTGIWLGTKAQYDAIATPDDQVAYIVTED